MQKIPQFYGKDYKGTKIAAIDIQKYDIFIDEENLFLIQFPRKTIFIALCSIIGLLLFRIIGLIAGLFIGKHIQDENRKKLRSSWFSKKKIISEQYKKHLAIEIPIVEIPQALSFQENTFSLISSDGKRFTLKPKKEALIRLKNFVDGL